MFTDSALILQDAATPADIERILRPAGFINCDTARQRLLSIADDKTEAFERVLPIVLSSLAGSPNPDVVLVAFERFLNRVEDREKTFHWFVQFPRAVEIALRVFVTSRYLSEILLQSPQLLIGLTERRRTSEFKSREQFRSEARETARELAQAAGRELNSRVWTDGFRRYQQQELLRIGVCDAFGFMDLKTVTVQLSLLADGLVTACLELACLENEVSEENMAVIAMGKLGGEELNYSSDIDLVFVSGDAATKYWTVARRLIQYLMDATPDGFLYRVDMRLRPWGQSGALVNSVEAQLKYLRKHGEQWERQALLKARVIAGNVAVGQEFLQEAHRMVFDVSPADAADGVIKAKQRIEAELARKGKQHGEVKSGEGSIRDVEFVTQYLQLIYGQRHPNVRSVNTLEGIKRLAAAGLISAAEFRQLTGGYVFLRTIEHSLQLLQHRQTHSLPTDDDELAWLASRLDFPDARTLLEYYEKHRRAIREIFDHHLNPEESVSDSANGSGHGSRPETVRNAENTLVPANGAGRPPQNFAVAVQQARSRSNSQDERRLVTVETQDLGNNLWQVSVVGNDVEGTLAILCGLLFAYDCNIVQGRVESSATITADDRSFVDVFQVQLDRSVDDEYWQSFQTELEQLMQLTETAEPARVQGKLVRRVAECMRRTEPEEGVLYPVRITVDNVLSPDATVLEIRSRDSRGFLYELANALAMLRIDVMHLEIRSADEEVFDTLFVTDRHGRKLTDAKQIRELRSAIVLIKHFTHFLPRAPDPAQALNGFRELLQSLLERDLADSLASLENADVLRTLTRLLGVSPFLWEDFLRLQHENLFPIVRSAHESVARKPGSDIAREIHEAMRAEETFAGRCNALNRVKDHEMFRADMRHIMGHAADFSEFSAELTDIADVVVAAAFAASCDKVSQKYGAPSTPLCVAALGKCGGRELGFASDIELVFLYKQNGRTSGTCTAEAGKPTGQTCKSISDSEYMTKVVRQFSRIIESRQEGIFQLDLRLRPYGSAGPIAVSIDAFQKYFAIDGPAWPYERQALVKLRPVAGDQEFGREVASARDELIYAPGAFDLNAMRAIREKQVRQLVVAGTINAKLSPGGLVDCEYLVQALQMRFGGDIPSVRTTNTRDAMRALADVGLLNTKQHTDLQNCYLLWRRIIDGLRMVRGHAQDLTIPPAESVEFKSLGRRIRWQPEVAIDNAVDDDPAKLMQHVELCLARVCELLDEVLPE